MASVISLPTKPKSDIGVDLPIVGSCVPSSYVRSLLVRSRERTLFVNGVTAAASARWRSRLLDWERESGEPVLVLIDSSGGVEIGGRALTEALRLMTCPTIGLVIGRAYSGACEILQGCQLRLATTHARLLVHHATGEMTFKLRYGSDADWIRDVVGQKKAKMESTAVAVATRLVHRTGRSIEEIQTLLKQDRILSALEAIALGMLDAVVSDEPHGMSASS